MTTETTKWSTALEAAHAAGVAAAEAATPPMMVVSQHTDVFNDKSPLEKEWLVPDGPCGFAWVAFKPDRGGESRRFVNWVMKTFGATKLNGNSFSRNDYSKSWDLWVSSYRQSMVRKEAYARAYAAVIKAAGIEGLRCYADSRMD